MSFDIKCWGLTGYVAHTPHRRRRDLNSLFAPDRTIQCKTKYVAQFCLIIQGKLIQPFQQVSEIFLIDQAGLDCNSLQETGLLTVTECGDFSSFPAG